MNLSEADIQQALDRPGAAGKPLPAREGLRPASVLLPLICDAVTGWNLLFIRRTEDVQDHKGQVAFPGGSQDPEDRDEVATALRETWEEVGVLPADVRVLGRMAKMPTITNYLITPVVGVIPWPYALRLSSEEVSRAFVIPLNWLADARHSEHRLYRRPNGKEEPVLFYELYDGELLWGVTAMITRVFLQLLGLESGHTYHC